MICEKSCKKHRWHDQYRSQNDGHLRVRDGCPQNVAKSGESVVDEDWGQHESWEFVPELHVESKSEVDDNCLENWHQATHWELGEDFAPEVGADSVHVVINLSEENRSLHGENEIDVINSTKSIIDAQEEKCSLSILYSCFITT